MFISVLTLAVVFVSAAADTVDWVSSPLRSGEVAMISGDFARTTKTVILTDVAGKASTVAAFDVSASALKFKMPKMADGVAAFEVAVGGSASVPINLPAPWWWQGDQGARATPGGWLRIFGLAIAVPKASDACFSASRRRRDLAQAVTAAVEAGDFVAAEQALADLKAVCTAHGHASSAMTTRLQLTPTGGGELVVLTASNVTEWDALFAVPPALATGGYTVAVSNGLRTADNDGWADVEYFESPSSPAVSVVQIMPQPHWDQSIFTVDCEWTKPIFERPCGWVGARASEQLDAAIALADANGGGVVYLPRGQYYVDGPIVVPEGVVIKGEGTQLVSLFFREDNPGTAPKPGYVYAKTNVTAWAVEDLTIYITHFYFSVIYVHPQCKNWGLQRVRIRAVAWAMLSDPGTPHDPVQNGRGNRVANFTRAEIGDVIYLGGNDNYRILDCDLLGTAIIIHTGGHGTEKGGSATNGYIARNMLWNANAAHWFDGIKQVIFEHNVIRPAGTELAWGNNIDNYENGYAQHVYHANNDFQCEWAGDREFMTFDPVFGDFNGPVHVDSSNPTLLTTAGGVGSVGTAMLGGMVSILQGAGAGQIRRLTGVENSSRFVIDKPFTTTPDSTSVVQVGPYKGRMIFHKNSYADGGAFQTYANAVDIVVSAHKFARVEALLSWGRASPPAYCPNMKIQFVDNTFTEGNHMWNWNATYPYPHPKTAEPYLIGVLGSDQDVQPCMPYPHGACDSSKPNPSRPAPYQGPINHLVVIKRNSILNNGGIVVRGHTTNVIVENNQISNSSVGLHVNSTHASHVYVGGNTHDGWM